MKEKLYTIEVMDALKAADECPCCYLERKMEQDTIAFVLLIWRMIYGQKRTGQDSAAITPR